MFSLVISIYVIKNPFVIMADPSVPLEALRSPLLYLKHSTATVTLNYSDRWLHTSSFHASNTNLNSLLIVIFFTVPKSTSLPLIKCSVVQSYKAALRCGVPEAQQLYCSSMSHFDSQNHSSHGRQIKPSVNLSLPLLPFYPPLHLLVVFFCLALTLPAHRHRETAHIQYNIKTQLDF